MDISRFQQGATYEQIQEWIQEKCGFHVTHLNIAKTKRKCGIIEQQYYNLPKSEDSRSPETPKEKEEAIIEAFKAYMKVAESQKEYVASNDTNIIEAYTTITGNGYAFPLGIYDHDTPVGFLMVGYDTDDYWEDAPAIANGNYNRWRLMIDERYQSKGYGREAVRLALDFIRTWPCGSADYCWLSYEPENGVARKLYRSFGFVETGKYDGEEMIAVLELGGENG